LEFRPKKFQSKVEENVNKLITLLLEKAFVGTITSEVGE